MHFRSALLGEFLEKTHRAPRRNASITTSRLGVSNSTTGFSLACASRSSATTSSPPTGLSSKLQVSLSAESHRCWHGSAAPEHTESKLDRDGLLWGRIFGHVRRSRRSTWYTFRQGLSQSRKSCNLRCNFSCS